MKKHLIRSLGVALAATLVSTVASARPQGDQPAPAPTPASDQKPQPCSKVNNQQPCTPDDDTKPADAKPADAKPADAKPADAKPADAKPAETKPESGVSVSITGPSSGEPAKDTAQAEATSKPEEKKLFWRGSTLLFDQNMTTQTAQLEGASPQQSYIPDYQWWISFRPRVNFTDKIALTVRADYYKEFTNAGDTTYYREDQFGDLWFTLGYKTNLEGLGSAKQLKKTKVGVNTTLKAPTSKQSQANGMFLSAGLGGSVATQLDINGEDAKFLNAYTPGLAVSYAHAFTTSTNATRYGTFDRDRQDTEGRSFQSDMLRGGMLVNHQMLIVWSNDLQITPKLDLGLSMIWINAWKYAPPDGSVQTAAGTTNVPRDSNGTTFTQQTWALASLDYELFDELSLGVGYYNLANIIAPNGLRRGVVGGDNILWSPDARVFFDVTANLDKIYLWASGQKKSEEPKKAASNTAPSTKTNTQRIQQQSAQ